MGGREKGVCPESTHALIISLSIKSMFASKLQIHHSSYHHCAYKLLGTLYLAIAYSIHISAMCEMNGNHMPPPKTTFKIQNQKQNKIFY